VLFRALAVLAAVVAAAGGCFAPEILDGQVPCGPAGECPSGFSCLSGRCSRGGAEADAGPGIDGAIADAPPPIDAGIDGPPAADAPPALDAAPDAGPGVVAIDFLGAGAGTVAGGGESCTSDCTRAFAIGVPVTFTATPAQGSFFAGWSGACTGSTGCQVTPEAAPRTLEATFIPVATVQLTLRTTGPGTLTPEPAGASCGAGCHAYASGTTIRIVPVPDPGLSFVEFEGGGCEASGTEPCTLVINGNVSVTGHFCSSHRVVDASAGMDTFEGTCARPFRTITKALSVAASGQLVSVRPGVYSTLLSEVFPLVIPDGVRLVGDEAAKGGATRIQGGGIVPGSPGLRAAVVLGSRATLAGFVVINTSSALGAHHGVVITKPDPGFAESAVVRNNTITMSTTDGIYLERSRLARIDGNVVSDQDGGGVGVHITPDATTTSVERNVIVRNTYGIEVSADADLGGGSRQSAGQNVFSCNEEIDVLAVGVTGTITVSAENNFWDHVPPVASEGCASNLDLCHDDAMVTTTGAMPAAVPCN
jgi:hypothetical protein